MPARVSKIGVPLRTTETISIGPKSTTARGTRYLAEADLRRQIDLGLLKIKCGHGGNLRLYSDFSHH